MPSHRNENLSSENGLCWQNVDDTPEDGHHDFLGDFINFDNTTMSFMEPLDHPTSSMHNLDESLFFGQAAESTVSSGISTGDDLDFLSSSSHAGPATSQASNDLDSHVHATVSAPHDQSQFQAAYYGRDSVSDTDLPRLERISIHSPTKDATGSPSSSPKFQPPVPKSKPNKFVEALSSTIRKAKTLRKAKRPPPLQVPGSPTHDQLPKPAKVRPEVPRPTVGDLPTGNNQHTGYGHFVHGFYDDPFHDIPPIPSASDLRYFSQPGFSQPLESPGIKSESGVYTNNESSSSAHLASWTMAGPNSAPVQWSDPVADYMRGQGDENTWLAFQTVDSLRQPGQVLRDPQCLDMRNFDAQEGHVHGDQPSQYALMDHRNGDFHIAIDHDAEGLMDGHFLPDTSEAGLMIHEPHKRSAKMPDSLHSAPLASNWDGDTNGTAPVDPGRETSLVGHPRLPPPTAGANTVSAAPERPHRPPRAPSAGARHLSCSPVRKNRNPSASPTPAQSRHSSGGSISSLRSVSGRTPATMPGTPCSVRKRRSRDASSTSLNAMASGPSGGSVGGGTAAATTGQSGQAGFVNFTPNDGGFLMTGVAPSGSSKTKARREKEALERRKKLSEAAMKAVAAAGGDVDKLIEQGFTF